MRRIYSFLDLDSTVELPPLNKVEPEEVLDMAVEPSATWQSVPFCTCASRHVKHMSAAGVEGVCCCHVCAYAQHRGRFSSSCGQHADNMGIHGDNSGGVGGCDALKPGSTKPRRCDTTPKAKSKRFACVGSGNTEHHASISSTISTAWVFCTWRLSHACHAKHTSQKQEGRKAKKWAFMRRVR